MTEILNYIFLILFVLSFVMILIGFGAEKIFELRIQWKRDQELKSQGREDEIGLNPNLIVEQFEDGMFDGYKRFNDPLLNKNATTGPKFILLGLLLLMVSGILKLYLVLSE